MPSLMATLGLDATTFNANAEKVVQKTNQIANKVKQAGSKRIDFHRGTGLATGDPAAFIASEDIAAKKERSSKARSSSIAREAAEAKRLDALEKDNAKSWQAQQRQQMALFKAAEAEKRNLKKQADAESLASHNQWVAQQKTALAASREANKEHAKPSSALGGAAKMFAGFLTVDFIRSKAMATMEYAAMIGALSTRLNASTTDLQAWDKALKQNGSSLKEVEPILDKINKNRVQALSGNARQMDAFSQLGIRSDQLKTMGTTDLAMLIGKSFESGQGTEQMIAALQRVGGDGATALVEAFQGGLGGTVQSVKDAGDVMSSETIARLKAIGDTWMSIGQNIASGFGTILAPVLQFATDLVETLIAIPKSIAAFIGAVSVDTFSHPIEALKNGADAFTQVWKDGLKADEEREKKIKEAADFKTKATAVNVDNKKHQKEEEALQKQVQREMEREMGENARLGKHSVNSLQQVGGFLGNFGVAAGPEVAAMNANVRSEEHLRMIREHLLKKKQSDTGPQSEVEF